MKQIKKICVFIPIGLVLLAENAIQVYTPNDQIRKPTTYTSGIKTYRKPSGEVQFHHNYSRVLHQNNVNYIERQVVYSNSTEKQLFPIYNAHTYGVAPQKNANYNINRTLAKNEDPTNQILVYKKRRQTSKIEVYHECPEGVTGQFVYDLSCNQFLNCWKGRGYIQNCAPGTLFNPKTLECDFAEKVECITGPRYNSLGLQKSGKIVEQIGCPKEFSGLIPDYRNCAKFINCANGIEHRMDCAPGTLFDVTKNICDYEHKVVCFNGQNRNEAYTKVDTKLDFGGTSSNSENYEKAQTAGKYDYSSGQHGSYDQHFHQESGTINNNNKNVVCPPGAVGIVKHPFDCSKFLNCANGQTFIQDCAPGTLFNPSLGNCDFPHNVKCDQHGTELHEVVTEYHRGSRYDTNLNYHGSYQGHYEGALGQQGWNKQGNHQTAHYPSGGTTHQIPNNPQSNKPCQNGDINCVFSNQNQYQHGSSSLDQQQWNQVGSSTQCPNGDPSCKLSGNNQWNGGTLCQRGDPKCGIGTQNHYGSTTTQQQWQQSGSGLLCKNGDPNNCITPNQYQHGSSGIGQQQWNQGIPTSGLNWSKGQSGQVLCQNQNKNFAGNNENQNHHGTTVVQQQWNQGGSGHNQPTTNYLQSPKTEHQWSQSISGVPCQRGDPKCRTQNQYPSGNREQQQWNQEISTDWSNANQNQYQHGSNGIEQQQQWNQAHHGYKVICNIGDQNCISGNPQDEKVAWNEGPTIKPNQQGSSVLCQRGDSKCHQQIGSNNIGNQQPVATSNEQYLQKPQTPPPFRRPYEPFFGPTTRNPKQQVEQFPSQSLDYDDTYSGGHSIKYVATTPRPLEKSWPPPFPSTDVNADYVFEYEDGPEVTLEAENAILDDVEITKPKQCKKSDFHCSPNLCISRLLVCNGFKDCPNGIDESACEENMAKFSQEINKKLAVLEKERWDNVTVATCAYLCLESQRFNCKSFNYRKIDKTCFLTNTLESATGALISYYPCDYYERISEKIDCKNQFLCPNKKCINKSQICDGQDDCGDRTDEKGCKAEDFGYSVRLTGSPRKNEGQIEVTAFGKTGFVCDDKFGLRDANVVCKELGFHLGAAEVRGNSFYSRNNKTSDTFYMMDDVTCSGNESSLMDCDFNGWGVHNCQGQEIVGVVCKTPQEKCPKDYWQCDTAQECLPLAFVCDGLLDCSDESDEASQHCDAPTEIRLVNGTSRFEGRVEIRHHGAWGTICDDDFNEDAAKVVCKSLGFKGSATVKKEGYFGPGTGPIWLDQVFCAGNESSIETCTHWNWGEHNCEHSEDVGVICSNSSNSKIEDTERHSSIVEPPLRSIGDIYPDRCGYRKDSIFNRNDDVHFRVVKGSIAERGMYPWQAAIRVKGKSKAAHWCGAVVISEKFVLTAAHCLIGYSKGAYVIVAGDYNVDEDEGTEQEAFIEDFYIHEDFRKGHKMNNDIALIKLKGRGFRFTDDVQAICLPDKNTPYEYGMNCTISGFGTIESGKAGYSHDLRAGWIPMQSRTICTMPHVYGDAITDGMICAGSLDEGIDACDGDSGGPLACLYNGVFTLFGITSWGQHCGYANKPGVYVKISYYRKWIDDTISKYSS